MLLVFLLVLTSGCCYPIRYDGPYKGKVVDAETGRPIKGVVVLGVWYREKVTVAGGVGSYYDADETVTDKDGDFEIKGKGLRILTNIAPMHVLIFKAGYQYIGEGLWDSLNLDGGLMLKKVAWQGDRAIIPLKSLTVEERKKGDNPPSRPSIPDDKMKLLTDEINKERIAFGLTPL